MVRFAGQVAKQAIAIRIARAASSKRKVAYMVIMVGMIGISANLQSQDNLEIIILKVFIHWRSKRIRGTLV